MKLDEFDPKDIDVRVQCLGKEVTGPEVQPCLDEVDKLRKEHGGKDPNSAAAQAFSKFETEFIAQKPNAVQTMLSGFGINEESPLERADRFKRELHAEETKNSPGTLQHMAKTVRGWLSL